MESAESIQETDPQSLRTDSTPAPAQEEQQADEDVPHWDDDLQEDLLPPIEPESHGSTKAPAQERPEPAAVAPTEPPAKQPVEADVPTAQDFYSTRPEVAVKPAQEGWRGILNRIGFNLPPGEHEKTIRDNTQSVQQGLRSHRTAMVVNLKGGSGKTTMTYLLSSVLGRVRGGMVLAWDNNENRGTLAYRSPVESNTRNTAIDLLAEQEFFTGSGQMTELVNFVRHQGPNKFDLLASQDSGSDRPVIDGAGFRSLHNILRSFYRLIIVDTGNASNASTWQAAAEVADEFVMVCENADDSAQTVASTIDALNSAGYSEVVKNSVAVVIDSHAGTTAQQRQDRKARLERITDHLGSIVRTVHVVPFEPALADGDRIEWDRLSPAMRDELLAVAASVIDGLQDDPLSTSGSPGH
ncbi:hypothetical protein AB0Y14_12270 [Rothia sp. HC945]|uniref:MinD/ParA family ATP-binding protein n=1 Tax=Rothia sp. HC945 TaxID=3171170 RepID=UPI003F233934